MAGLAAAVVGQVIAAPALPLTFAMIVFVGSWQSESAGRKANDPPRDDYWVATLTAEPSLDLDSFGDGELEQNAADLLFVAAQVEAHERTMVTAHERADGARRAGNKEAEEARLAEAEAAGRIAADYTEALADRAWQMAELVEADTALVEWIPGESETPSPGPVRAVLPEEVLMRLTNAGIDLTPLDADVHEGIQEAEGDNEAEAEFGTANLAVALARSLRNAGEASREYGRQYIGDLERDERAGQ